MTTLSDLINTKEAMLLPIQNKINHIDGYALIILIVLFVIALALGYLFENGLLIVFLAVFFYVGTVFFAEMKKYDYSIEQQKIIQHFEKTEVEPYIKQLKSKSYVVESFVRLNKNQYRVVFFSEDGIRQEMKVHATLKKKENNEPTHIDFKRLKKNVTKDYPKGYYHVVIYH